MARKKKPKKTLMHVRLDGPLHGKLEKAARERGGSLNSEIVHRLEESFRAEEMRKIEDLIRKAVREGMDELQQHPAFNRPHTGLLTAPAPPLPGEQGEARLAHVQQQLDALGAGALNIRNASVAQLEVIERLLVKATDTKEKSDE